MRQPVLFDRRSPAELSFRLCPGVGQRGSLRQQTCLGAGDQNLGADIRRDLYSREHPHSSHPPVQTVGAPVAGAAA